MDAGPSVFSGPKCPNYNIASMGAEIVNDELRVETWKYNLSLLGKMFTFDETR